ncbi:MAG: tetratricopeptide repeat protein [Pseudohongiellaceae bacterium]
MKLTIEQAFQQGLVAQAEGKAQDAERIYRAILQSQPKHPDANHNLGVLAVLANKAEAAIPFFKTALQADPKKEQFWFSYIDALIKEQKFDEAKRAIEQIKNRGMAIEKLINFETQLPSIIDTKIAPQGKKLTLKEKRKKLAEGKKKRKSKKQRDNTRNRLELETDPQANYDLGNTLFRLEKLDEAESSYRQAIALMPNYTQAHYNLSVTIQKLGRLKEAEASYKQVIELKPDYAEAHYNLGILLQELGRFEEAEISYGQAITSKLDYAEAHCNLGIMLEELGRLDEAESSYRQAIMLKPDYAPAHYNLGNTLLKLDRLDEAETSYRQAIALKPNYAEAHGNLGVSLHRLKKLEEAAASYSQVISLKPYHPDAYYNLGCVKEKLNKFSEAEVNLRQAIALKPDYAGAYTVLGHVLRKSGILDGAASSYRQALAFNADDATARHLLAAISGETTATAPQSYVENLFDTYSADFDPSLEGKLGYKTPKAIAEILMKHSEFDSVGSVLDLGCGTGLFGVEISQTCEHLKGIDLSGKMLNEARKKGIYNELIKSDILTYLSNEELRFDYFVAADVFIYIGDLSDVFRLIRSRNQISGKLAFSTEDYVGEGFSLGISGRFSHSKKYIESLCNKFAYNLRHFEKKVLRKENNEDVSGAIYLLDF